MIDFSDDERAYLFEMRRLTKDSQGMEVFVGLTRDETVFYVAYSKKSLLRQEDPQEISRYLELQQKHERARLSVIDAEAEIRSSNPRRH